MNEKHAAASVKTQLSFLKSQPAALLQEDNRWVSKKAADCSSVELMCSSAHFPNVRNNYCRL